MIKNYHLVLVSLLVFAGGFCAGTIADANYFHGKPKPGFRPDFNFETNKWEIPGARRFPKHLDDWDSVCFDGQRFFDPKTNKERIHIECYSNYTEEVSK